MNFLDSLSKNEIIIGIGTIITLLLFIAGAVEKLFDKKYLGSIFCSFVWKCCKGIWKWARNEQLNQIKISLDIIQKEVTPNGGGSMKDVIGQIKRQHEEGNKQTERQHKETWTVMMGLHNFARELAIRMDISDEADNRMSFKLGENRSCIYISQNFLRFFAFTEHDMLGTSWEFCIEKTHVRTVRNKWKEAYSTRKPYRNEQIIIGSDARRHLCLVRGFPLEDRDGNLTGFFGSVEVLESLDE